MPYAPDQLASANKKYVESFGAKGALPLPPGKHVAIVACMDARIDSSAATGLHEGDSHHIRNAGGRASDALRSLVISQELLGTREIIVIHHTDCGMLTFNTPHVHGLLKNRVGPAQHAAVDALALLEFSDVETSIKDDVAFLKQHPLILPETAITGYNFIVETGELRRVV